MAGFASRQRASGLRNMHRVEYPSTKPVRREVTVRCTDGNGVSQQRRVPLVSLATLILNSVQAPVANRSVPQLESIEWSDTNV